MSTIRSLVPSSPASPHNAAFSRGALQPGRWVYGMVVIAVLMVLLKTNQRMADDGMGFYAAFHNALLTRAKNHSTFLLLADLLICVLFAVALRVQWCHTGFRLRTGHFLAAGLVSLTLGGLYLQKCWSAPDPGTFFSNHDGTVYLCQCIEGTINLLVLTGFAFWSTMGWTMAGRLDPPDYPGDWKRERLSALLLITGAAIPVLMYGLYTWLWGTAWVHMGWGVGNDWPGLLGYTFIMFTPAFAVLVRVVARCAHRLSLRDLYDVFTKAGPKH